MRGDVLVKIFAGALIAASLLIGALILFVWSAIPGDFTSAYPGFAAILGGLLFAIFCVPQFVGGVLAWRFGSVASEMAQGAVPRDKEFLLLRIAMGIVGLVLAGVLGLSGLTFVVDFGFSGVCGLILIALAIVGPSKVAGTP
jgi:hypothetical protein